jgi:hypothetical protein
VLTTSISGRANPETRWELFRGPDRCFRAGATGENGVLIGKTCLSWLYIARAGYLRVLHKTFAFRSTRPRPETGGISRRGTTQGFYSYDLLPPVPPHCPVPFVSGSSFRPFNFRHCYVHYRDFPLAVPSVSTSASIKHARDTGYIKFTALFLAMHRERGARVSFIHTGFLQRITEFCIDIFLQCIPRKQIRSRRFALISRSIADFFGRIYFGLFSIQCYCPRHVAY